MIDDDGYPSTPAQEIHMYTKSQIRLCAWNTWPTAFKREICGPLLGERLAFVRFDIARWAIWEQSNHISYSDIIQPNFENLTEALRKYRLADLVTVPVLRDFHCRSNHILSGAWAPSQSRRITATQSPLVML